MKNLTILLAFLLSQVLSSGQATVPNNTPQGGAVLGWNDFPVNTVLNINQNSSNRMRLTSVNWAGLGVAATQGATRISIADAGQVWGNNSFNQTSNPFSMLHLGNQIGNTL